MEPTGAVRGLTLGAMVVSGLVCTASPAGAAAVVEPFSFTVEETFPDSPSECLSAPTSGVTTAVETVTGQRVVSPSGGVSVHGVTTFRYRTTFADGSFLTGVAQDRFTFNSHGGVTVTKNVIREPRTIFSADGAPVQDVMIHFLAHTTLHEGDDEPTVSVERFRAVCL